MASLLRKAIASTSDCSEERPLNLHDDPAFIIGVTGSHTVDVDRIVAFFELLLEFFAVSSGHPEGHFTSGVLKKLKPEI